MWNPGVPPRLNHPLILNAQHRRFKKLKSSKDAKYTNNFFIVMNQLVFVTLCARNFLEAEERTSSVIYGLLLCHISTYCALYIKELIERKDWDISVRIAPTSNVKHLALTSINVGLEWTKAITFFATVFCIILILGAEEGFRLENRPTVIYLSLTLIYYILTEQRVQEMIPNILVYLPNLVEKIQGLESLYAAIILKASTIFLSLCVLIPVLPQMKLVSLSFFSNVYRPYKSLKEKMKILKQELDKVKPFREATEKEIEDYEDVCTICLTSMKNARITPCQHYFHSNCLRLCLKTGVTCPVCKRNLYFQ